MKFAIPLSLCYLCGGCNAFLSTNILMKRRFSVILLAVISAVAAFAEDVEFTQVKDLTSQYFIMAYSDNGTYRSPYWIKGNHQNVMSPGESALICSGKDYYYLLKLLYDY